MTLHPLPHQAGHASPTHRIHLGVLVVGVLTSLAAAAQLAQLVLQLVLEAEVPLLGRLGNVALFVVPAALLLWAGLSFVRAGLGHEDAAVWPRSTPGRWSLAALTLAGIALASFAVGAVVMLPTSTADEGFFSAPWLAASLLTCFAAAIVAFLAGTLALVRLEDRGAVVVAAVAVGWFATIFGTAEIISAITGAH